MNAWSDYRHLRSMYRNREHSIVPLCLSRRNHIMSKKNVFRYIPNHAHGTQSHTLDLFLFYVIDRIQTSLDSNLLKCFISITTQNLSFDFPAKFNQIVPLRHKIANRWLLPLIVLILIFSVTIIK